MLKSAKTVGKTSVEPSQRTFVRLWKLAVEKIAPCCNCWSLFWFLAASILRELTFNVNGISCFRVFTNHEDATLTVYDQTYKSLWKSERGKRVEQTTNKA